MSQLSFSDAEGQAQKRKVTRREAFLNQMKALLPWKELERPIQQITVGLKVLSLVRHAAYSLHAAVLQPQ